MKIPTALLTVLLVAGCSQSPTEMNAAAPAGQTGATPGAGMKEPAAETAAGEPSTAMATGTVESIDAGAGKITIAHGPVEALEWPAMTMAFKATPDQIASVQSGQDVTFEFEYQGAQATITRIAAK